MIASEIYSYIKTNYPALPLGFATGDKLNKPYAVLLVVSDPEQGKVFCEDQGEAGDILLQFTGVADGAKKAYGILEGLKDFVQKMEGDILPSFQIWKNRTEGVRTIQGESLNANLSMFESTISWNNK